MKTIKYLIALLLLLTVSVGVAPAAELQPYAFPFIGKWNPSEDPMLIDDYGFQDIQNLRKEGKHFKGVKGHTKINTTVLPDLYVVNGFHFTKEQPQESHIIVYAGDATTPTTGHLYQNTTAVPGAGDFSSTVLYTPTTFTDTFRFSNAPNGNMVSSNAAETLIWGGNELPETAFLTSSAVVLYTVTNPLDYSDILNNTSQAVDQIATFSTGVDSYTKLLIHAGEADGTAGTSIIDSETSAKTITAVGNAQEDIDQSKFGSGSVLFDGTGDYLTVPDHADWYFGADPFTIDTWARPAASHAANTICGQYVNADNYWYLNIDAAPDVQFVVKSGGTFKARYYWSLNSFKASTWHHLELVRNGTNVYLFQNGLAITPWSTPTAISTNEVPNLAAVLEVGASYNHTYVMNGYIDEFRISKGVARHTSNFTPGSREYGVASNYFLVGSRRPLQGAKFYIPAGGENTETSTLTVKEFTGTAWASLTATDNTAVGGKALAQTGTVTWSSTVDTSVPRYINGLSLYWYQFYMDAGSTQLYYVTVDAPIQTLKNIWDGESVNASKVKKYISAAYTDYSNYWNPKQEKWCAEHDPDRVTPQCWNNQDYINLVGDNDDNTFIDVSSLATTSLILLGFEERMQGFDIRFVPDKTNSTGSTTMSLKYWNGSAVTNVQGLNDGTATSTTSFNKNGVVSFTPVNEGEEFKRQIGDSYPLYYYEFSFAAALDASVQISEIRGIPAPKTIPAHRFSTTYQNRLWLFDEVNGGGNVARYSALNSPDIFNGKDSGMVIIGNDSTITAAASLYNVLTSTTGSMEQLIITKKDETHRLIAATNAGWNVQKISSTVGCTAPLTMTAADLADIDNTKKQIAIWMNDKGVYMSDGNTVRSISDDIKVYFNPDDVRYIPAAMQSKSIGWYDNSTKSYKLLVASGATATYLNTELEYSLKYNEWTKIYREEVATANPLQSGFQVFNTDGGSYSYGGGKNGFMYRLENSNRFDGTRITSYLHTKDLILDQTNPIFRLSTAKMLRTTYKKKQTGAITIEHFGDGVRTTSGVNGQEGPTTITAAEALATGYNTQTVLLGPYLYHSFKYSATTNIEDGLELTGIGIYAEPYTLIR